jgi:hypothetical protein
MPPERRARISRPLAAAVLAGALLLILIALDPTQLLRAFALLILLFLPGYLIAWPFLQPRMGSAAAFTIAGGLSIAMVAIAGLVLNVLPWGLNAGSWGLYVIVLFVIGMASIRRRLTWRVTSGAARHELILAGVGGTMMVAALLFARLFAAFPTESFTQLWITASSGAPKLTVQISIHSNEQAVTACRLEVLRNGEQVRSWANISLATGQTWSDTISVGAGRIEARLFRLAAPEVLYRSVTVQLGPTVQAVSQGGG